MNQYNAAQLRKISFLKAKRLLKTIKRHQLYLILDNLSDTYNIGAFFRLADALTVKKIYLCGKSEFPPHPKIKAASVGTDRLVPWKYIKNCSDVIKKLKKEGVKTVAVEQQPMSLDYRKPNYQLPVALIFGNENTGLSPKILKQADFCVELPMYGANRSLNVLSCASVIGYWILKKFIK